MTDSLPTTIKQEAIKEFRELYVRGRGPISCGDNYPQEAESWVEAWPEEMEDWICGLIDQTTKRVVEEIKNLRSNYSEEVFPPVPQSLIDETHEFLVSKGRSMDALASHLARWQCDLIISSLLPKQSITDTSKQV